MKMGTFKIFFTTLGYSSMCFLSLPPPPVNPSPFLTFFIMSKTALRAVYIMYYRHL